MHVDAGRFSPRLALAARAVAGVLAFGCSAGVGAQQTCGLSFIPGPSGQINDPSIEMGSPIGGPFAMLSADLAGSGRRDLILGIGSAPPFKQSLPLRILRQNAAGNALVDVTRTLLGQGPLPSMEHPREIVSGDFNGDGKNDVFVAAHGYDTSPFEGERNVLLLSTPAGTYSNQSSQLPTLPDFSHSATTGDVNGDGYLDIFVGNLPIIPTQPPYFLLGGPGGTFTKSNTGLPDDILVGNVAFLSSLLVDLDGDRFPELVLGVSPQPGKDLVLWNDGTGNFKSRARLQLPDGVFGTAADTDDIASLDVNDDGLADLALITTQQDALSNIGFALQLLVNKGDGTFVDESQARLGAAASRTNGRWWTFLRVADVNRDGWDDFYAVGGLQGVSVPIFWINRGDGTFCAADNTTFFSDGGALETMDIDGDGRLDFVRAGYSPDSRTLVYFSYLNRTPATLRSISVGDVSVAEGNSGTSLANFSIRLSQAAAGAVAFDIFTDTGTATPGQDYLSGAAIGLSVPAGQTSVTFPIAVLGDTEVEDNETFTVNLANVRHAAVGDEQGLGRITNDDLASLAIADVQLAEGTGGVRTASFVISLSKPMPVPVSFAIATGNGTATSGDDYIARSLTRNIDPGRTRVVFDVAVVADALPESTEDFLVTISNVGGASLADGVAVGTILDDDAVAQGTAQSTRLKSSRSLCLRGAENAARCNVP